jgi:PPP family 3-phenylpropionic acid transporter
LFAAAKSRVAGERRFGTPLRLGLFYATLYISTGVSSPYIAVWFKARGLSGGQIGAILALPLLARVATGPALAVWADRFQLRRTAILIMAGASAALYGAMMAAGGFWAWLWLWFLAATLFGACSPLTDVIVLRRAARDGFAYAFPRGIGSAAYIVGNVGCGALLAPFGAQVVMLWIVAAAVLSVALAPLLLPPESVRHEAASPVDRFGGVGALLRDPVFMLMVVSVGLIQGAHAFYYSFSTLVWRAQGISSAMIGLLWGVGVGVELVFLWFGEGWRRRLGPERLLILGGVGAVVRWTAFAFSPPVWLLFPLQALHALSFTSTFIASLQLVERLSPPQSASAAQTLNAALYSGLLIGGATLISGPLFDRFGALGYLAMSGMAGVGLMGAIRVRRLLIAEVSPKGPATAAG